MRAVYLWKTSVSVHIHIKDVRSDRFTKGATPHNTPYTIHVSINVDRHVNFVRPSIRSHSVSFVFFWLSPAQVTPLKDDST